MGPYNEDGREPIIFTFRTEPQYATTDYELYQLSWQVLIDEGPTALKEAKDSITSSDTWEEKEVNGTMPYPGIEKFSGSTYIVLSSGEQNVDENGLMGKRSEMKNLNPLSATGLSEYKVRKR